MPELPEVETVRRGLAPHWEGQTIVRLEQRRPDLRFPFPDRFAERVEGARVEALSRRAKYLLASLSTGETLLMHLGMSGRFTLLTGNSHYSHPLLHTKPTLCSHDHVVFQLGSGAKIVFTDPRRFGFMELIASHSLAAHPRLAGLGPEPLSDAFSPAWLDSVLAGRTAPVKAALLDQSVIAGLGNIYVCEALHRAGISPRRLSRSVPGARAARLAPAIVAVLTEAIAAGGSTLRDFAGPDGSAGYFPHAFRVYGRAGEPCPDCSHPVSRTVQAGRSTFSCTRCQR